MGPAPTDNPVQSPVWGKGVVILTLADMHIAKLGAYEGFIRFWLRFDKDPRDDLGTDIQRRCRAT
jgi:hypothetical protein